MRADFSLTQRFQGIEIKNAVISIHIDAEGKLVKLNHQFLLDLASRVSGNHPVISALYAIKRAAKKLNYDLTIVPELLEERGGPPMFQIFSKAGISQTDIPVKLMYQPMPNGTIRLAWDLSILEARGSDWWSIRVDAISGEILDQENWTLHCNFEGNKTDEHSVQCKSLGSHFTKFKKDQTNGSQFMTPNSHHVFPIGTESPNHGNRTLEINPSDNLASPYGWHDTNEATGAEYTTTKGKSPRRCDHPCHQPARPSSCRSSMKT